MPKILIVDDSKTIRGPVVEFFEEQGFQVSQAIDGSRALEMLSQDSSFDLIITDLNMPVMTGLEFVMRAKRLPAYCSIPFLILSTEGPADAELASNIGVKAWLVKPFNGPKIFPTINKLIAQTKRV